MGQTNDPHRGKPLTQQQKSHYQRPPKKSNPTLKTYETPHGDFLALCYHDVQDFVHDHYEADSMAISSRNLMAHFAWMKENGYNPISIDQLLAARKGETPLPPKPVLITFDDGLKSIYTRVYPILKVFNYPAVVALVPSWIESKGPLGIEYGADKLETDAFMTWKQIRELDRKGLIEFASHSYDLHHGVVSNPQGNKAPAGTTRICDMETKTYENDKTYRARIRADLAKSVAIMKKKLGKKPRVMCWPYGKYNGITMEIARDLGMPINLTIESDLNKVEEAHHIRRNLIMSNPTIDGLVWMLRHPLETDPLNDPRRMVRVELDRIYHPNKVQQARNLDRLLDRVKRLHINMVILQAFSDADRDGKADSLYFPNRHLPVKDDIFNRVAWQLKTRCGTQVYAWMPVSAFDLRGGSIFDPKSRERILDIYEDLGRYSDFEGLFFDIDGELDKFKDNSRYAAKHYRDKWSLPLSASSYNPPTGIRDMHRVKLAEYMSRFAGQLQRRVERNRSLLRTAAYIRHQKIMRLHGVTQVDALSPIYRRYFDFTVIMVGPHGGKLSDKKWLRKLSLKVSGLDPGLNRTIFEMQSVHPDNGAKIESTRILNQMEMLQLQGGLHVGYYPEDFMGRHPDIQKIFKGITLQDYPYLKR